MVNYDLRYYMHKHYITIHTLVNKTFLFQTKGALSNDICQFDFHCLIYNIDDTVILN